MSDQGRQVTQEGGVSSTQGYNMINMWLQEYLVVFNVHEAPRSTSGVFKLSVRYACIWITVNLVCGVLPWGDCETESWCVGWIYKKREIGHAIISDVSLVHMDVPLRVAGDRESLKSA